MGAVVPVAGTKKLFGGENWGHLKAKAKLESTGSMLMIFRVSAFKQLWKLGCVMCSLSDPQERCYWLRNIYLTDQIYWKR